MSRDHQRLIHDIKDHSLSVERQKEVVTYLLMKQVHYLPETFHPFTLSLSLKTLLLKTDDIYEVQAIVDYKVKLGKPGQYLYRVQWKNYSSEHDIWEPVEHFSDLSLIEKYWATTQTG